MQKKINILLFSLVFALLLFILVSNNQIKLYRKKFTFLDKNIVVNIYSKNSNLSNKALNKIEKIYNLSKDDLYVTTKNANKVLKDLKIKNYLINAQGNIIVGSHYENDYYKVGLENPNIVDDVFKIIKIKNKSIVSLINESSIDNGVRYFEGNYKGIYVISNDLVKSKKIATILLDKDIEEGKKYIEELKDVDAIWFLFDDTIINSSGIKSYE